MTRGSWRCKHVVAALVNMTARDLNYLIKNIFLSLCDDLTRSPALHCSEHGKCVNCFYVRSWSTSGNEDTSSLYDILNSSDEAKPRVIYESNPNVSTRMRFPLTLNVWMFLFTNPMLWRSMDWEKLHITLHNHDTCDSDFVVTLVWQETFDIV